MAVEPVSKVPQADKTKSREKKIGRYLPVIQRLGYFWGWVGKSFIQNRCPVRASALAYTTLLALIPVLAIVLSVSATFLKDQGEARINDVINTFVAKVAFQLNLMPPEKRAHAAAAEAAAAKPDEALNAETREKTKEVAQRIHEYIRNVRSGTLGVTGVVALIFVGISLLSTIEVAFNDIWGAAQGRSWLSRVINYWAAITLGPILLVVLLGLKSVTLLQKVPALASALEFLQSSPTTRWILEDFLPFAILALILAAFYLLMPNTKVRWKSALIGGLVAASLWQVNSHLNFLYVSQVARSSQIYGGLGAVPIFLLSLYLAWLIVLFGSQVAYAIQNRRTYLAQKEAEKINQRGREFIALRIMTLVAEKFHRGDEPPTLTELSEKLSVPSQLVCRVITPLQELQLLVEVKGDEVAYSPGRPLASISYQDILEAMRTGSGQELATRPDKLSELVRANFTSVLKAERETGARITLEELVTSPRDRQHADE